MGAVSDAFNSWLQDYVTAGVPSSGALQPSKAAGRAIGALIESYVSGEITSAVFANSAWYREIDLTADTGAVSAAADVYHFRVPAPIFLSNVRLSLTGASSSGAVQADVLVGGVSVFATKVQVDAGQLTSTTSGTPMALVNGGVNILDDSEIEISITAGGTGATGLKCTLIGETTTYGVAATPIFVATAGETGGPSSWPFPASGVQSGDTAILWVGQYSGSPNLIRPSGWTALGPQVVIGGMTAQAWYKACDGTENGTSVTVPGYTGGAIDGGLVVFRGCATSGPPYESLAQNAGTSNPLVGEPVTTTGVNRLVVTLFICSQASSSSGADTGWTQAASGFANSAGWFADTIGVPLPATVTAPQRTVSGGTLNEWASWSFALVPAA